MLGMRRTLVMLVLAAGLVAAAAPAEKFNVPGQRRTRTPAEMKGERIPLRFADGTPTGFFAHADDPSRLGDHGRPAKRGFLELDAQEILTTTDGMKLLFHPGGGPDHYEDHVEKGQYGHVAVADLKAPVKLAPRNLNGKPAPTTSGGAAYLIAPTRIPRDMWYKPNVDANGRSGSTYFTYGNPGFDKTRGRGDWTYINWSWVQNGGAEYPANVCGGGGMVRAIGKRGMTFVAADVAPVVGYSYGPDNRVNGRVTAFYGRTTTGPGDGGSKIFGWLVLAYQKSGDVIVPCVRRAPGPAGGGGGGGGGGAAKRSGHPDRMARMAENLLAATVNDPKQRDELLRRLRAEPDAGARIELLTELSRFDDAETVRAMLELLRGDGGDGGAEKDARVREQAVALLGFMRAAARDVERVTAELKAHHARATDEREKARTLETLEKIGAGDATAGGGDSGGGQPRRD